MQASKARWLNRYEKVRRVTLRGYLGLETTGHSRKKGL